MSDVASFLTNGDSSCIHAKEPAELSALDEMPTGLRDVQRPVLVICAYASNQEWYGTTIYMNKFAREVLGPHFYEAQKKIFITKEEYEACYERENLPAKQPSVGTFVHFRHDNAGDPDELGYRIFQLSTMDNGLEREKHFDHDIEQGILHLPRKMLFRVRTVLTLIHIAAKAAGLSENSLFMVTLGKALVREGLTVKTWTHELPLTCQICPIREDLFDKTPAVNIIQALGRLCGIRGLLHLLAPILITCRKNAEIFKKMVSFNSELIDHISRSSQANPLVTIGQAMATLPIPPADQPKNIARAQVQLRATSAYCEGSGGSDENDSESFDFFQLWRCILLKLKPLFLDFFTHVYHKICEGSEEFPSEWLADKHLFQELESKRLVSVQTA